MPVPHPKFTCLSCNPECDIFGGGSLHQVMRVPPRNGGISVLIRSTREIRVRSLSMAWAHMRWQLSACQEVVLTRNTLDLGPVRNQLRTLPHSACGILLEQPNALRQGVVLLNQVSLENALFSLPVLKNLTMPIRKSKALESPAVKKAI